jgi:hypothetical protein
MHLDLSYNQIDINGFLYLVDRRTVFAGTLRKLCLERNLIKGSLALMLPKVRLPELKLLDLNLNEIEVELQGYRHSVSEEKK